MFLVSIVCFGRRSTYFVAFGFAIRGSAGEALSVLMRLLLSGGVLAGVAGAVVLRFLDDGVVALHCVVIVDAVEFDA